MSDIAIRIASLHKTYREGLLRRAGQGAVRGIDFTVARGESWALVGPNGAGKTTTLHCLLGLLGIDSGTVEIFGQSPLIPAARQRVGFQSEIFFTYPKLSAHTCLRFYGELSGLQGHDLDQRIHRALGRLGLENVGTKRVGSFSKGMVQRLGLAQSLLHDPDLIIWDEPTSGLDPEGRRLVVDLLKELKAEGKTVLLSTHVLPDIERVSDKVAMMHGGKILLSGEIPALCAEHGMSLEDLYLKIMKGLPHAA